MVKLGLTSMPQASLGRLEGGQDGIALGGDYRLSGLRPPRNGRMSLPLPRSKIWCQLEEQRFKSHSVFRRLRGFGTVRVLNSAQYRLEKERERENQEEEDDDDLCPIECVREFHTQAEFDHLLEQAKEQCSLVVVDFFRTACGSCKYIEKGFVTLCKGAGNNDAHVMFLKHNVMDEYEEQSEVADRLRIKVVPLFQFYKDGVLVESFATREKTKILEAICKHTSLELSLADLKLDG
ncbi:hypothetical protein R1flu_017893 [Riccia fluitans]|uniref:Thioredoxin domain-containing protein n=1 Tax=Riccia fluitans TaxID=41844 RepID=A0ABD1ZEJ8_9MARC